MSVKPLLKLFLVFALIFTAVEVAGVVASPVREDAAADSGVISETDGTQMIEHRQWEDLGLVCHGCEYVPAGTLSQTARTRTSGGARRIVTAFKNVFVKDRTLVNTFNPIGFVSRSSNFASGTLSAGAHFILLRKFLI